VDIAEREVDRVRFSALLDDALSELSRRDDSYLARFPLPLPDPAAFARAHGGGAGAGGLPAHAVETALEEGNAHLRARYATQADASGTFLAEWVAAVALDAYSAAGRRMRLESAAGPARAVREAFAADYELRSAGGADYYVRRRGAHPVVLVSATGVPIEAWQRFLSDSSHDYKLLVPVRRHGDLFAGGISADVRLEDEAADMLAMVEREALAGVHVLGWCNGARPAVELAALLGERAASLTFTTPMLKGIAGVQPAWTRYAKDLQMVLDIVGKDPRTAKSLAKRIGEMAGPIDWSKVAPDDAEAREEIFRLPNRRHLERLVEPLLSAGSLVNVARRVVSDETHPTMERLAELRLPVLALVGSHDIIVSNQITLDALRRAGGRAAIRSVAGAGHDVHDLQYPYFRYALDAFVGRGEAPVPSARLRAVA
jgi:pimeloyl-ACP methyl ester carboxylesterase